MPPRKDGIKTSEKERFDKAPTECCAQCAINEWWEVVSVHRTRECVTRILRQFYMADKNFMPHLRSIA
jgi:hypothetical protein